jgi:predicted N-acetyltransferase YhbS
MDVPELEALIEISVHGLQAAHYTAEQRTVALGPVFGVDRQLIRDGTYFVAEDAGRIVGCGGWSKRLTMYGGDRGRLPDDVQLDPAHDAARVRAFFVHPQWARRGIGRSLLRRCEEEIVRAGFRRAEMVATLTGEPLYAKFGYQVISRDEAPIPGGMTMTVVRMGKVLDG